MSGKDRTERIRFGESLISMNCNGNSKDVVGDDYAKPKMTRLQVVISKKKDGKVVVSASCEAGFSRLGMTPNGVMF